MIHQVMHSGNIKTGKSTVINRDYIRLIISDTKQQGFTGLTLYLDGSFLTLYEGDIHTLELARQRYTNSSLYSNITTMFSRQIEKRAFSTYRLGLGRLDTSESIESLNGCFHLTAETLDDVIPSSIPNEFKILARTFARVNQIMAV
ncbi:hypothetical protein DES40_1103 [Litorimonas taeanensis]|uniref:BLUF domain-containing protein n=1 Tax=Litorimonas taeanensis TaxID=568099 RepID=A0A420WL71_9PROT|nr:hypothetical protein [Litorimonas taeanensis]RKQ71773.1 hypothetical protein DES40_1103 [Litorimonas taeanensis]